jgi:hypothetical protein
MPAEIDILRVAARSGYAVVEKDTNVLWTDEDLADSNRTADFEEEDRISRPDPHGAVTRVFPGCLQQMSRSIDLNDYTPLGQTRHFLVFVPTASVPQA